MRIPAQIVLTNESNEARKRFEITHVEMPSVAIIVDQFGVSWQAIGPQHLPAVEMFTAMLNFAREVYTQHFTCWNGCRGSVVTTVSGVPVCAICADRYVGGGK